MLSAGICVAVSPTDWVEVNAAACAVVKAATSATFNAAISEF